MKCAFLARGYDCGADFWMKKNGDKMSPDIWQSLGCVGLALLGENSTPLKNSGSTGEVDPEKP